MERKFNDNHFAYESFLIKQKLQIFALSNLSNVAFAFIFK